MIDTLFRPLAMHLTTEEDASFRAATRCWICAKEKYKDEKNKDEPLVRDHCHITGKYRGAAHRNCNWQFNMHADHFKLPVFFHNLTGYDAHVILSEVYESKYGKITCIPRTSEKFVSFTIGKLVFKDSMNFLSRGLDKLVANLKPEQLKETRRYIEESVVRPGTAMTRKESSLPTTTATTPTQVRILTFVTKRPI